MSAYDFQGMNFGEGLAYGGANVSTSAPHAGPQRRRRERFPREDSAPVSPKRRADKNEHQIAHRMVAKCLNNIPGEHGTIKPTGASIKVCDALAKQLGWEVDWAAAKQIARESGRVGEWQMWAGCLHERPHDHAAVTAPVPMNQGPGIGDGVAGGNGPQAPVPMDQGPTMGDFTQQTERGAAWLRGEWDFPAPVPMDQGQMTGYEGVYGEEYLGVPSVEPQYAGGEEVAPMAWPLDQQQGGFLFSDADYAEAEAAVPIEQGVVEGDVLVDELGWPVDWAEQCGLVTC